MNAVEIKNVSVYYHRNVALDNVCLKVRSNSFVTILGPNGSGKTTLLCVINGLRKLSKGEVFVFGKKLSSKNVVRIRKDIGYVPQSYNLDSKLPFLVRDIINIGRFGKLGFFNKLSFEDKKIIDEVVCLLKIEYLLNKPIGHLSGGEYQKVQIARALVQQPKILLLDEPTSNLDPKSQYELLQLIENIYLQKQITTIFVTHILSHIPNCCSEIVLMKNGKIISVGKPEVVLKEEILSNLYECSVQITFVNHKRHFHIGSLHP